MTWTPLDTGNRWAVLGVTVFFLTLGALIAEQTPALALVNESPSVPRGLYLRQPGGAVESGAMVALPQPPIARRYLGALGMPDEVLLIKRVAAVGGDQVCRVGAVVRTPDRVVPVLDQDRRGMDLPGWTGCRRLAPDELFLLGDTPGSFDSRYFGPVRTRDLEGVFRETLTW
ncbi:S26 family signal peptidase [Brevundimonas staleyi]|uniref:S26 family signal peptidase n=1 Tax=Brevundimonas staleyi TaxID=74326 RepID=A0ABW0FYP8_9CAUL|nr:S26 family signal peptidase [Brevundimonas sp.]MDK2747541.1 S26 family signal peptidase [Brevundimonas sp.]MEA3474045.1 S26 family signal peptidase [Pseudomonadota bacterium]